MTKSNMTIQKTKELVEERDEIVRLITLCNDGNVNITEEKYSKVKNYLTQQRTELEKKFKKDKKQPKDKLGDDFTKFLESEGYQVRDCEVEKCKHKWIQIEYDLMKCLKCNKVKKL